jgi:hypothetical protein
MLNHVPTNLLVSEDIRRYTPGKGLGGFHPTRLAGNEEKYSCLLPEIVLW